MMTEGPPWPWSVAAPPTTLGPSGPAATGATPSASSAVAVSKRLRKRGRCGCIAAVPLQPSREDEEEPRVPARAGLENAWRQRTRADQALPLRDLRSGEISGYCI